MHWEPHVSIKRKNHREIPLYVCSLMGSCNHVGISRNNFFLRTVCSVPLLLNLEFPIHGMTIIDLSSCSAWILNLIRKQREMIEILNSFHHSSYSHNLQTLSSPQCIFCTFLPSPSPSSTTSFSRYTDPGSGLPQSQEQELESYFKVDLITISNRHHHMISIAILITITVTIMTMTMISFCHHCHCKNFQGSSSYFSPSQLQSAYSGVQSGEWW